MNASVSSRMIPLGMGLVFLTGTGIYLLWNRRKNSKNCFSSLEWEEVGTVKELIIYPLKSARGISLERTQAADLGLRNGILQDRSFIIFRENGLMVTGRECPLLTTITTGIKSNSLTLKSLQGEQISIDFSKLNNKKNKKLSIRGDPAEGVDCGDSVADWLSTQLFPNKPTKVRLYYCNPSTWKRGNRQFKYFNFPNYVQGDTTLYNDCTSYNIASTSSLEELNSRLEKPVGMEFFRPPIVVEGLKPWDEDTWEYIKIGKKVILRMVKPCERCELITVDPFTGEKRRDHMNEMMKYRLVTYPKSLAETWSKKPIMGLNCGIEIEGQIRVGDSVEIVRAKNSYWRC